MRHPRRGRNISLAIAGLGAVSLAVALVLSNGPRPGSLEVILGVLGLKAVIVGGVIALYCQLRTVRRFDRLQRGEGVLVRGWIDPVRWRDFRQAAVDRAETPGMLPSELELPAEIPAEGIEVVVAPGAFRLGREFEPLEKNAVARLVGPVLELEQRVPQSRYSTRRAIYRLPVPENAAADVARLTQAMVVRATTARNLVRKFDVVLLVVVVAVLIVVVVMVAR